MGSDDLFKNEERQENKGYMNTKLQKQIHF